MQGINDILLFRGEHAYKYTSYELRYIKDNWCNFKLNVKFYRNNKEVDVPW